MRLFHFSEDPAIEVFVPRPVAVPAPRPPGQAWLNGPLVWAVSEERQATYLFPRECPRILLWPTPETTAEDEAAWWAGRTSRMIACTEWGWLHAMGSTVLHRYELPAASFRAVDGDWMWVSEKPVEPLAVERLDDLLGALAREDVELRLMPTLAPLAGVWSTTLHASGIRLRNARGWPAG